MKSSFDLKHGIGKITPETADDLWVLSDMIHPGNLLKAKTKRSIEVKRGDEKEKVGKRSVILTIIVEDVDFTNKLRVKGRIAEGPEDMTKGYHTISIEPGTFVTLQRTWKSWEINKIKAAEKKAEPVLALILDESEADIFLIREKSERLVHLKCAGLGKGEGESKKPEYYGKVIGELKRDKDLAKYIIIAGPGFVREEIVKLLKNKEKEIAEKVITDGLSHTGNSGLQELLRRGILERVIQNSRITEETNAVEEILREIVKEGKVTYGFEETKKALKMGAIEKLLISDKMVREFENLLEDAEKMRTDVMIISTSHESGEKLFGLGGIAALLRYKLD